MMTKEEILAEIERLKKAVEDMDDEPNDTIYLLSVEEYEKYKDKIPHINTWWWLRSNGNFGSSHSMFVRNVGSVNEVGDNVCIDYKAVRPALKYSKLKSNISQSSIRNSRFIFNDFPFVVIDRENEIAIAEVPIAFDKFDDESNDYENSYIRQWLLDWKKGHFCYD